jgi:acylphosphatase
MNRQRMQVFYSGPVQGVGFRYAVRQVAQGYEVTGLVRNLLDGRVELVAEGEREELEAFRVAVRDSGLGGHIRHEAVTWCPPVGHLAGFQIVR